MILRSVAVWAVATVVALSACAPAPPGGPPPSAVPPTSPSPTVDPPQARSSPRAANVPARRPRPAVPPPAPAPVPTPTTPTAPPASRPVGAARYAFPVEPASAASYGRDHHDYPATDIFAACGTTAVSPVAGTVDEVSQRDDWDPEVDDGATRGGLSVSIIGDDGVRYYASHYEAIRPEVRPGVRVSAGQALGTVGRTGSARPTPCHLHFGISPPCGQGDWEVRRGVVWPWRYLDAWRAGQDLAPVDEVTSWRATNPQRCPGG